MITRNMSRGHLQLGSFYSYYLIEESYFEKISLDILTVEYSLMFYILDTSIFFSYSLQY